jgi:hypothetical protein|tara:strand:- start:8832 stop:9062 length:231 start_codon:yes stop_codon:yes gene_type:complete
MPTYTMINKETGQEQDMILSLSERDILIADGNHTQKLSVPKIVSGVGGTARLTSDGWKDTLREIKKGSGRDNTINI